MKRVFTTLLTIILISYSSIFAQESLKVLDPQSWWSDDWGTIEEATLSIRPHGIYMEYGLYLTFSARDTSKIQIVSATK
jgi:hypothetical protein